MTAPRRVAVDLYGSYPFDESVLWLALRAISRGASSAIWLAIGGVFGFGGRGVAGEGFWRFGGFVNQFQGVLVNEAFIFHSVVPRPSSNAQGTPAFYYGWSPCI